MEGVLNYFVHKTGSKFLQELLGAHIRGGVSVKVRVVLRLFCSDDLAC